MVGNLEKTRVRTGKFSGNYGFVFLGDAKGNFEYIPQTISGLLIRGDARHIVSDSNYLIVGINNSRLKIYRK